MKATHVYRCRLTLIAAAVILGPGAGSPALAQQTAEAESGGIQEVVVTAQKRAESLQSVPVSVTAITSAQLGEVKMDTPSDLTSQVPNLQVNGIVGEGTPLFSLRGVSMFDYSLSQSSPVASYVDEVYKGNFVLFGVEMFDLDRVEVLRGPQGTLYGKNTTGGAVNFITHKPGFDDEAAFKVGLGNYGRKEFEGALQKVLISDRLSARFAFTYTKVNGFIRNVLPGHPDLEGVDQYGLRLSVLFKATDTLDLWLRYVKSLQDPQNYTIIAGCATPPVNAKLCPGSGLGIGFTGYWRSVDGTATGAPLTLDQVAMNFTPRRRQEDQGVALTANWAMAPDLTLTSISSWDEGQLYNPEGTDGSPIDIFKIPYFGKTRQVAQDLRVTSSFDGPFNFIGGAYYQHEIIYNQTTNYFETSPQALIGIYNNLQLPGLLPGGVVYGDYRDCVASSFGGAGFGGYAAGSLLNPGCKYYNQFDQIRNSWAVYSDASYKLTDLFKLRAGLRYTHENAIQKNALSQLRGSDDVPIGNIIPGQVVNGVYSPVEALPGSPNYAAIVNATTSQAVHNTAVTGRAGVDFTPTRDILLYASYSRGFRSAAFNGQFFFTNVDFTSVKPETVDALEIGAKTAWLDNRLQLNGALFYYQYKNQQYVDVQPSGQQPLINLAKSRIEGGELELVTRPVRSVTLRAGLGALNTRVQDAKIYIYSPTGPLDVSGHQLPYAPKFSGTLAADWDALTTSAAVLTLHVDGSYASRQYFELRNEERIAQGSYGLLNGRISLHSPEDRWGVGLWMKNAGDKFYATNIVDLQGLGYDYRHRGVPRMYGVDANFRF